MKRLILGMMAVWMLAACNIEEPYEEDYDYNHALVSIDGGRLQFRQDCLICHGFGAYEDDYDDDDEPTFSYAGTVWNTLEGVPDSGVTVLLISLDRADTISLVSDEYGNFYTDSLLSTNRYVAAMKCGNEYRVMEYEALYGGCNDCHRPGGRVAKVLNCN
ncbi:MAG: hypothetical protein GXO39_03495 [Thermotogae bacterium]|nr:hypothetical protein [Thermotogota bacterium]